VFTGGALLTVTCPIVCGNRVPSWPTSVKASVFGPFGRLVVSRGMVYGAIVAVPTATPFAVNSTPETGVLVATVHATVPTSVAPAAMLDVPTGGTVKGGGPATPPTLDAVALIPRPAREWWDDVVATCSAIRVYCRRPEMPTHAESVPLLTLWQLAQPWYRDRLDQYWTPQPTSVIQRLLDDVGLAGPFWRLPD
jgi:hypothetical protein